MATTGQSGLSAASLLARIPGSTPIMAGEAISAIEIIIVIRSSMAARAFGAATAMKTVAGVVAGTVATATGAMVGAVIAAVDTGRFLSSTLLFDGRQIPCRRFAFYSNPSSIHSFQW